ncbi:DinB family protein [Lewinella cohaerens]|uniref:DinB family protein n=1 Tax=Lewinella cohaerens TaxID=70995 RepID=UPI000380935A|nr:DinB family protein [Lewinella cohaerens]
MEVSYKNTLELLAVLEAQAEEVATYFLFPEVDLAKTYAPGKWTVCQLLHHLTDAETVLYERIRRGIARPGQVVWGFDPDCWADQLDYVNRDLGIQQAIYHSVRRGVIDLATSHYELAGTRQYVHNETGLRTVKEEFDKVAWHSEHHLKQIRAALKTSE